MTNPSPSSMKKAKKPPPLSPNFTSTTTRLLLTQTNITLQYHSNTIISGLLHYRSLNSSQTNRHHATKRIRPHRPSPGPDALLLPGHQVPGHGLLLWLRGNGSEDEYPCQRECRGSYCSFPCSTPPSLLFPFPLPALGDMLSCTDIG